MGQARGWKPLYSSGARKKLTNLLKHHHSCQGMIVEIESVMNLTCVFVNVLAKFLDRKVALESVPAVQDLFGGGM